MARMPGRDLAPLVGDLRKRGILVRYFATPGLRDAMRISIGTPTEMSALIDALRSLMASRDSKRELKRRR